MDELDKKPAIVYNYRDGFELKQKPYIIYGLGFIFLSEFSIWRDLL